MSKLKEFRETSLHTAELDAFLATATGRAMLSALREERKTMTTDKSISELRLCGRHDVFQELDDFFAAAISPLEPRRAPISEKGGAPKIKPHQSRLPS